MKRKFPGNVNLMPGLLLTAGVLAFVLLPDNAETKLVFAPENPGIAGTTVTARFVETTTRYVDDPVPVVDRPVIVADVPVPVEERTEIIFQQPDDAIADVPRAVNMAMAANETYRLERQVERVFATARLD